MIANRDAARAKSGATPRAQPGEASSGAAWTRHAQRSMDLLEVLLIGLAGLSLATFTGAVLVNVVTRSLSIPIPWLQQLVVAVFVWGTFVGGAAAVRRGKHFRVSALGRGMSGRRRQLVLTFQHCVVAGVAIWMSLFGYENFLAGLGYFMQPSGVPIAVVTAAIPVSGILIALFSVEHLIRVWTRMGELPDNGLTEGGTTSE